MPKQKHAAFCLVVLLSIGTSTFAKNKPRDWQSGTLVDSSTERGTRVHGNAYGVNSSRDDLTFYKIDAGSMMYTCARSLRSRSDKQLDVTINRPVQFALEGSTCYLQDAEGKEHKLSLDQKIGK
jgi:hypothetical protein